MLGLWADPRNSQSAHDKLDEWMIHRMEQIAQSEAQAITKDGYLQSASRPVDAQFILDFDLSAIHGQLKQQAEGTMRIMSSFAVSLHTLKSNLVLRTSRRSKIVASLMLCPRFCKCLIWAYKPIKGRLSGSNVK
ncbi:hypothetical protein EDD18DRAFT_1111107 [Armillaria luteobubalina]|uniref:Uncharacterized protein n=1 Tax=Armillaria luteobubalina TaxID=153913 RepID=A0AA39PNB2_9AGAR|nr:hypothetical protein EDD18DRAFT_1111107 [Armillaria luteobubalina]